METKKYLTIQDRMIIEKSLCIKEETTSNITKLLDKDPNAPYQKGACERNHEFIRCFVPNGKSFNDYSQAQINLMMNNINSYIRGEKKEL